MWKPKLMQNLKRVWSAVLKLTWETWKFFTWPLKILKKLHFNGLFLNKVYYFWAKKRQNIYVSWNWQLIQNLKESWLVLSKMRSEFGKFSVIKRDSDLIFESKMVVLNETKNLKQLNLPHAVTKPILPWK